VRLDQALQHFIDTRKFPSEEINISEIYDSIRPPIENEIPATPHVPQQQSESDNYQIPVWDRYQADPLKRTQKGRVNPLLTTKTQLKSGRNRADVLWKRWSQWKDWITSETRKAEHSGSYKILEIICIANIALHLDSIWLQCSWKHWEQ